MADDEIRLDRRQVERIITRAVGDTSPLADETLSLDDVRRIADELDIPLEAVDAAVAAELAGSAALDLHPGRWVPTTIEASRRVAGPPAEVRASTHAWLGRQEGLRLRRTDGPLEVWEKDPSLIASFRSAMKLRAGSGRLREYGDVRVVVGGVGDRSSVSLGTSVTAPRATASIVSAAGVTGSLITAAIVGGWAWLFLGLPLLVLSVVAGVAAGRAVANSMRDALDRALDGIEQGAPPPVDSVGEVIGDLRDAVDMKRAPRSKQPGSDRRVDIRWE